MYTPYFTRYSNKHSKTQGDIQNNSLKELAINKKSLNFVITIPYWDTNDNNSKLT